MKKYFFIILLLSLTSILFGQTTTVEGYIYESGNRGFLPNMSVTLYQSEVDVILQTTRSNEDGYFQLNAPSEGTFRIQISDELFHEKWTDISTTNEDKIFLKVEMERAPGYVFEVTLAEERKDHEVPVDAIKKARIEVYNNTIKKSVLELIDYSEPDFKVNLKKGNHYTILIRRRGFLAKRMEAFVDVEGCILCFEGVGDVRPGISEGLTSQNSTGILLANVELQRSFEGRKIELNDLYYDLGSARLKREAQNELNKLILFLNDNPNLKVEIGSHTDSRGEDDFNMDLSSKRAKGVVTYLINSGDIDTDRLISQGYGESQLKNGCKDGVVCEESEHAINRRTELKLVGNIDVIAPVRSLASMKQEEHMEELLREIQEEGIIEIPSETSTTKDAPNDQSEENIEVVEEEVVVEEMVIKEEDAIEESENNNDVMTGGYGISLISTDTPIPEGHIIFQKFEDLKMFKVGDTYQYIMGKYETEKEAQDYIDARLFRSFPEAKVFERF